jgi:hypothetical protein
MSAIAFAAFERPDIEAGTVGHDPGQVHAVTAIRAARAVASHARQNGLEGLRILGLAQSPFGGDGIRTEAVTGIV